VSGVATDPFKQKLLVKLLELARDLGAATLAGGVEEPDEAAWLLTRGVDYLQGYLFAQPAVPPPLSKAPPPKAPLVTRGLGRDH
jgi:EAL domain-containing protein (putative c-di-GMP-specific phosphodiesterase class I)